MGGFLDVGFVLKGPDDCDGTVGCKERKKLGGGAMQKLLTFTDTRV